jgi:serpin B
VYIPKFNFTRQYILGEYLKEMGMPSPFTWGADFSGMDGTRNLFIKDVIHKAFVGVNEKGTEAAGATAVIMTYGLAPSHPIFRADHPFVFLIQERVTGTVLFLGRVVNPTQ